MRRTLVPVHGLEDFGLTLPQILKLSRSARLRIEADVRYPNVRPLFPLEPADRRVRIDTGMRQAASEILKLWPGQDPEVHRSDSGRPHKVVGTIAAPDLSKLLHLRSIGRIWLKAVGRRKRKPARRYFNWYAVLARFAIQVEGETAGLQDYEDRTIAVKAYSETDAVRRLQKGFEDYAEPYLNLRHLMVRWTFETVLEVTDLVVENLDPEGTEVYSSIRSRRMKKALEWHPRKLSRAKK